MILRSLIKVINQNTNIEITDHNNLGMYFGSVKGISKFDMKLLGKEHIEEVNPFVLNVEKNLPLIQIRLIRPAEEILK